MTRQRKCTNWISRLALAAVLVTGAALWPGPSRAQTARLPDPMPGGYTAEQHGAVRWIYPSAAESAAHALMQAQRAQWQALAARFGSALDPRLDIRIGVNPEQMQALAPPGTQLPSYASGVAFPAQGLVLLTLTEPGTFLRPDMPRVLKHELAHVALHRALQGRPVPRWFSEGVAIHEAGEHSIARVRTLWEGTLRGELIPVAELERRFPTRHGEVNLAYAQSAGLVGAMLDGDGDPARFQRLIAALRAGDDFEQAFSQAYGATLPEYEQRWQVALANRFGRWPSLLMGLTTVWALAALLLLVGYLRVRHRHRATMRRWEAEERAAEQPTPRPAAAAAAARASIPPPPPPPRNALRNAADPSAQRDRLDSFAPRERSEPGVPKVMHEGRSYTLH